MKELTDEIEKLETSKPIFRFVKSWQDNYDMACQAHAGNHTNRDMGPIQKLVRNHFREHFNSKKLCYEKDIETTVSRSLNEIENHMTNFIEAYMDQKEPRLTKLYKFFRRDLLNKMTQDEALTKTVFALYKHMIVNSVEIAQGKNNKYTLGCITVMKAIMDKYGDS